MNTIIAGMLAIMIAAVVNKVVVKHWGINSILWAVPLIEELSKLLSALILGVPFLITYLIFGIGEAFYDLASRKSVALLAALLSIGSHYVFGLIAEVVWGGTGNIWLVIGATSLTHMAWNRVALSIGQRIEAK